jgi:hypothetical protein
MSGLGDAGELGSSAPGKDRMIHQRHEILHSRLASSLEIRDHRHSRDAREAGSAQAAHDAKVIDQKHARRLDDTCSRKLRVRAANIRHMGENIARAAAFIDDDGRPHRTGAAPPDNVIDVHSFASKCFENEVRILIEPERAGKSAARSQPRRRHERRRRQPAAMAFPPKHVDLRVRQRIVFDIKDVVDGGAPESE